MTTLYDEACERAHEGMEIAVIAARVPDRVALYSDRGNVTFADLNAAANRIARLLRSQGIGAGDPVALLCSNREEFAAVRFAAHRTGVRLTPVNWHLTADEIAYIVDNCEARALFADAGVGDAAAVAVAGNERVRLKVAIGGAIDGFDDYEAVLAGLEGSDIDAPVLGDSMLYTSGTTGRPKGVYRPQADPHNAADLQRLFTAVFQFEPESGGDSALVTGPLYHSGPYNVCLTTPLTAGIAAVVMERFDAEQALALIERHRITHAFFVPTMFHRLLALPPRLRERYDVSSLRFVIHGAAPTPVHVKRQMLAWFGPVIWEMFAGTEGAGTVVGPEEWLAHPGTVGRAEPGQVLILDDDGRELPAGQSGRIFLPNPDGSAFEYFGDESKTRAVTHGGYFTAGDIGYLDDDGYLFITGRSAEVIIAGGVNIYPQEIDDVLIQHPAVADAACVGAPNDEWGEEVCAVIQLAADYSPSPALAGELVDFAAQHLARQKLPRRVEFVGELPRSAAGKVLRRQLRERYWAGRERTI